MEEIFWFIKNIEDKINKMNCISSCSVNIGVSSEDRIVISSKVIINGHVVKWKIAYSFSHISTTELDDLDDYVDEICKEFKEQLVDKYGKCDPIY